MRVATEWDTNPSAFANEYPYSSASILYNSTRTFSGVVVPIPSQSGKTASDWNKQAKSAQDWDFNPDYFVNERNYDTSNIYDSALLTYDGVNGSQSPISTKNKTAWDLA